MTRVMLFLSDGIKVEVMRLVHCWATPGLCAGVTGQESSRARSHRRLSSRRYYKLPVVIIMLILVKHIPDVIYNINAM